MHFLPRFVGLLNKENPTFELEDGRCFKKISFSYEDTTNQETGELDEIRVKITTEGARSLLCYDWIVLWTHQFYNIESFHRQSEYTLTFTDLPVGTKEDVRVNGVRINLFCTSYTGSIGSLWKMSKMFLGGLTTKEWMPWFGSHIPAYQEAANLDFIKNTMGW